MGRMMHISEEFETRTKEYVSVVQVTDVQGKTTPIRILREDGSAFDIQRILAVDPALNLRTGQQGTRYNILVRGHATRLWHEDPRWFVMAKDRK